MRIKKIPGYILFFMYMYFLDMALVLNFTLHFAKYEAVRASSGVFVCFAIPGFDPSLQCSYIQLMPLT